MRRFTPISHSLIEKYIKKEILDLFKKDNFVWRKRATLSCFEQNFNTIISFFKLPLQFLKLLILLSLKRLKKIYFL